MDGCMVALCSYFVVNDLCHDGRALCRHNGGDGPICDSVTTKRFIKDTEKNRESTNTTDNKVKQNGEKNN